MEVETDNLTENGIVDDNNNNNTEEDVVDEEFDEEDLLDIFGPDELIEKDELIQERLAQIAKNAEDSKLWLDRITRRRMFAFSRIKKLEKMTQNRKKFLSNMTVVVSKINEKNNSDSSAEKENKDPATDNDNSNTDEQKESADSSQATDKNTSTQNQNERANLSTPVPVTANENTSANNSAGQNKKEPRVSETAGSSADVKVAKDTQVDTPVIVVADNDSTQNKESQQADGQPTANINGETTKENS